MFHQATLDTVRHFATPNQAHPSKIEYLWLNHTECFAPQEGFILLDNIAFILSAHQRIKLAQHWYHLTSGMMLFAPINLPFYMDNQDCHKSVTAVHLTLDIELLNRTLIHIPPPKNPVIHSVELVPICAKIADCLTRLIDLLHADNIHFLAKLYQEELYYYLLHSPLSNTLRHIANPHTPLAKIQRICREMQTCVHEKIHMPDLAKQLCWGETQFYRYFRQFTGLTPLQYHKQLKLNYAKNLILNKNLSISEIAYQVGYESPSQFSREYKRYFGVNPRTNLEK